MSASLPDDIRVRPARPADARPLAEIHVASWREAYRGLLPARFLDELSVDARERGWRRRLERPSAGDTVLVAVRGGRPIGFVSGGLARDDDLDGRAVGEIYAVYVVPEQWSRGVGRLLLTAALDELAASGFEQASLWVLDTNARARGFYEHLGWRSDGATKEERFGVRVTEVRYRRALRSPR